MRISIKHSIVYGKNFPSDGISAVFYPEHNIRRDDGAPVTLRAESAYNVFGDTGQPNS